jgi:hypothetical protein
VQALGELPDTLSSDLLVVPVGLGVAWMLQVVPFRDSANVTSVPVMSLELPAAVQAVAELHDTPSRELALAPGGLGVTWMLQAVPSHASTRVVTIPDAMEYPTAVPRSPAQTRARTSRVGFRFMTLSWNRGRSASW